MPGRGVLTWTAPSTVSQSPVTSRRIALQTGVAIASDQRARVFDRSALSEENGDLDCLAYTEFHYNDLEKAAQGSKPAPAARKGTSFPLAPQGLLVRRCGRGIPCDPRSMQFGDRQDRQRLCDSNTRCSSDFALTLRQWVHQFPSRCRGRRRCAPRRASDRRTRLSTGAAVWQRRCAATGARSLLGRQAAHIAAVQARCRSPRVRSDCNRTHGEPDRFHHRRSAALSRTRDRRLPRRAHKWLHQLCRQPNRRPRRQLICDRFPPRYIHFLPPTSVKPKPGLATTLIHGAGVVPRWLRTTTYSLPSLSKPPCPLKTKV